MFVHSISLYLHSNNVIVFIHSMSLNLHSNNVIVHVNEGPGVYEAQDLSPSTLYTVYFEIVSEDQEPFISPLVTVTTDDDIDG